MVVTKVSVKKQAAAAWGAANETPQRDLLVNIHAYHHLLETARRCNESCILFNGWSELEKNPQKHAFGIHNSNQKEQKIF